jgi:hypothetical protein
MGVVSSPIHPTFRTHGNLRDYNKLKIPFAFFLVLAMPACHTEVAETL